MPKKKYLRKIFPPNIENYQEHEESVTCLNIFKSFAYTFYSGSLDGSIKFWKPERKYSVKTLNAHKGGVRGLCSIEKHGKFLSCSEIGEIKLWDFCDLQNIPIFSKTCSALVNSIDYQTEGAFFVTGGEKLVLWDLNRFLPLQRLNNQRLLVTSPKFNPLNMNLLSFCDSQRIISVADLRSRKCISKIEIKNQTNGIVWSKKNPWKLVTANEDGNVYIFDLRNMKYPLEKINGHHMSIQSVDVHDLTETISTCSLDGSVNLYKKHIKRRKKLMTFESKYKLFSVKFFYDEFIVVVGGSNGNIKLINFQKNYENSNHEGVENSYSKFSNFQSYRLSLGVNFIAKKTRSLL